MSRLATTLTDPPWDGVTVREMTVAELDRLLHDTGAADTMLDWLYADQSMTAELITTCTGLEYDALAGRTPSELAPLIEAVKAVNPVFFARARAERARMQRLAENPGPSSAEPSAP